MAKSSGAAAKPPEKESGKSHSLDLSRAMHLWMSGDWTMLAARDKALIAPDRDRGLTAAFVAAAHHFCDDHEAAEVWSRTALSWGCPEPYLLRVLAASVQITMARMAAIGGDITRARSLMALSAEAVPGELSEAYADARLSKELAAIGLLGASTKVISDDLDKLLENPLGRVARLRLNTLHSEIRILRHQLVIYQMRGLTENDGDATADESSNDGIKRKSVSQLGQDLWVLEKTGHKRGGFFVEFGATDGVLLSNTLLLEKMFGWSGLLAEPNPDYFAQLKKNRSSRVTDACIAAKSGETVEFVLADEFGGIKDYIDHDHHSSRRKSYAQLSDHVLQLETISLDDFLKQNNAPTHIDYISIDTEGSELDILRAFPFEKWDVSLWTVEHNYTKDRDEIFKIMTSNGYLRKKTQFDDWYYKADR